MTTQEHANGRSLATSEVLPTQPSQPSPAGSAPVQTSEFDEVQTLATEQAKLHQLAQIQADPVFVTVLSQPERDADREVAEQIRERQREYRLSRGLEQVKAQAKHDEAQDAIDAEDRKQRVTLRKAQRKRDELTDGGKNLAATYRYYRGVAAALAGATLVGIGWTSYNVATGLNGGEVPSNLLLFGIEPLFSVPLVCIVIMQMVAAMNGRLHHVAPTKTSENGRRLTAVGWIEVALLAGTTVIGVWPSLVELFGPAAFDGQMFAVRLIAPALVVMSVVLQLVAAELFGAIIRDAWLSGDEDDTNIRDRVRRANSLAQRVQAAMAEDSMPLQDDGLPSVSAIQKRFPCEKLTAQCAHDALALERETERG